MLSFCIGRGGLRSVFVMDNATSHHNQELVAICYDADVYLVYLPLYSPDLNLIEISVPCTFARPELGTGQSHNPKYYDSLQPSNV